VIVVDTSAWIEFLRDTGSPVCIAVEDLLDDEIAICDPISMEVLAGG
jgi:predicted nucleic acid-binding protein